MSTTNFGRGHAAQAQEAPVRGSGDGYRLRSRSVDASAKVGNRRPTPVRYPKGQESTLDTEIELRNVIEQQNLTPVTHVDTQNITLAENENLTLLLLLLLTYLPNYVVDVQSIDVFKVRLDKFWAQQP